MSRGYYDFKSEIEHLTYKTVITAIVNCLVHNTDQDGIELTNIDVSPAQVRNLLEELEWFRIEHSQDRDTRWEYFENDAYPGKMMSLITDIDLFSMTIDVFDKEEE